jgi:hypothetical protein
MNTKEITEAIAVLIELKKNLSDNPTLRKQCMDKMAELIAMYPKEFRLN